MFIFLLSLNDFLNEDLRDPAGHLTPLWTLEKIFPTSIRIVN